MDYIATNIKFLRTILGLSQEELANKVDLNRGNITSYERGVAKPGIEIISRIANFFEVDLISLVQRDLTVKMDGDIKKKTSFNNSRSNLFNLNNQTGSPASKYARLLAQMEELEFKRKQDFYGNISKIATALKDIESALAIIEKKMSKE